MRELSAARRNAEAAGILTMDIAAPTTTTSSSSSSKAKDPRAFAAKRAAATLGEIVGIFMRSPSHRELTIAEVERILGPAIIRRQFLVVKAPAKDGDVPLPGAVILWAEVSSEVDARLSHMRKMPLALSVEDRLSGDTLWITDVAGDARLVNAGIEQLLSTQFPGRKLKMLAHDRDGKPMVLEHRR